MLTRKMFQYNEMMHIMCCMIYLGPISSLGLAETLVEAGKRPCAQRHQHHEQIESLKVAKAVHIKVFSLVHSEPHINCNV